MNVTNVQGDWNSTGDLLFKRNPASSTGRIELGTPGDGVDLCLYGASTSVKIQWDESANLLTFADDGTYANDTFASVSSGSYSKKGFIKVKVGTVNRYIQLTGT